MFGFNSEKKKLQKQMKGKVRILKIDQFDYIEYAVEMYDTIMVDYSTYIPGWSRKGLFNTQKRAEEFKKYLLSPNKVEILED